MAKDMHTFKFINYVQRKYPSCKESIAEMFFISTIFQNFPTDCI